MNGLLIVFAVVVVAAVNARPGGYTAVGGVDHRIAAQHAEVMDAARAAGRFLINTFFCSVLKCLEKGDLRKNFEQMNVIK